MRTTWSAIIVAPETSAQCLGNGDLMNQLVPILYRAFQLSALKKIDIWQLSVEVTELFRQNFTVNDIRECLLAGLCELRVETTSRTSIQRTFRHAPPLSIPKKSCLVITDEGVCCYEGYLRTTTGGVCHIPANSIVNPDIHLPAPPVWNLNQRSLYYNDELIKQFRCPAQNQETVLSVFHEMDWPVRIDDPLPMIGELDPKQRLQDTVKGLNRNRKARTLKFSGDGTGSGIIWQAVG